MGADFSRKIVQWDERTTVRLQLWDIAGQDRFGPPPFAPPALDFKATKTEAQLPLREREC